MLTYMLRGTVFLAVLLLGVAACSPVLRDYGNSTRHSPPSFGGGDIELRAIFWDLNRFSPEFRDEFVRAAARIAADERNESYTFTNGAISRDLGSILRAAWQQGKAKTVRVCVSGSFSHPGASGEFSACRRDYHDYPDDTYFQQTVSRALLRSHGDPQFRVEITLPQGCRIPAFLGGRDYFLVVSTRTMIDGVNELLQELARQPPTPAHNLHFLLECSS